MKTPEMDDLERKADRAQLNSDMDQMVLEAKAAQAEYDAMTPEQRAEVDRVESDREARMFSDDTEEGIREQRGRNLAHDAFERFRARAKRKVK